MPNRSSTRAWTTCAAILALCGALITGCSPQPDEAPAKLTENLEEPPSKAPEVTREAQEAPPAPEAKEEAVSPRPAAQEALRRLAPKEFADKEDSWSAKDRPKPSKKAKAKKKPFDPSAFKGGDAFGVTGMGRGGGGISAKSFGTGGVGFGGVGASRGGARPPELRRSATRWPQGDAKLAARDVKREAPQGKRPPARESYIDITDNPFTPVDQTPLSTFSIDVDTASYANVRRYLKRGQRPPADAVRIEELINYFDYDYAPPTDGEHPFAVHVETASSPWGANNRLVRIGLKGREIHGEQRPSSNLVFLLDVSGSMSAPDKLPLLQQSLGLLLDRLGERDRVAIVVYAGASGLALPSTPCSDKATIKAALDNLQAGGSTNGAAGIELAYQVASEHFIQGGTNRVILATDGDFNVGATSRGDLTELIEEKARGGVYLSVLGFGMSHYGEATMEQLANKGNGNHAFIDTANEARKVLVEQLSGTLVTIARDVKIQVEFNPAHVAAYRLIGYTNRLLAAEDFNDDAKDAGEIGAGHAVTALYELVPVGQPVPTTGVDPLKYQKPRAMTKAADSREILTLKLRYKQPDGDTSRLMEFTTVDSNRSLEQASADMRFAVAVASFGHHLRHPEANAEATQRVLELARGAAGDDPHGYREEFMGLVEASKRAGEGRTIAQVIGGSPAVKGSISKEIVRRVIRRHIREVKYCYEQQLIKNKALAGRVVMKFTISEAGRVASAASVSNSTGNGAVATCVAGKVRRWVFPQPKNGVAVVTYPFVFTNR